jgi:hypothetical protein
MCALGGVCVGNYLFSLDLVSSLGSANKISDFHASQATSKPEVEESKRNSEASQPLLPNAPLTDEDRVREGKQIVAQIDVSWWRLAELADDLTTLTPEEYALEIGVSLNTLERRRAVRREWLSAPGRILEIIKTKYAVARELVPHPDKFDIIARNPDITKREAQVEMLNWRAEVLERLSKSNAELSKVLVNAESEEDEELDDETKPEVTLPTESPWATPTSTETTPAASEPVATTETSPERVGTETGTTTPATRPPSSPDADRREQMRRDFAEFYRLAQDIKRNGRLDTPLSDENKTCLHEIVLASPGMGDEISESLGVWLGTVSYLANLRATPLADE